MTSASLESPALALQPRRIRRLTVAGALDEALRIVHEQYRELITAALLVMFVPMFVMVYIGGAAFEEFAFGYGLLIDGHQVDLTPLIQRVAYVSLPLMALAYGVAEPLCIAALVVITAGVLTGHRTTVREALRHTLGCSLPLLFMWFLRWISIKLGTICFIGPGFLMAALFFSALPVLVLEGVGPLHSLRRSMHLVWARLGEAVLLVVLLGLIEALVLQCAQFLPAGIPRTIGIAVVYSSMLSLYATTATTFYFSARCREENYDLQLWVQQLVNRDAAREAEDVPPPEKYARV